MPGGADTARRVRECQVRICEGLGVKFPGPTRHFRRIKPLPTLSACPLRSDRVRSFAPQQFDAMCQNLTHALQQEGVLFDHLVGGDQKT